MNIKWTTAEKQFIGENASKLSDREGAIQLSARSRRPISKSAYRKERQRLGISKMGKFVFPPSFRGE